MRKPYIPNEHLPYLSDMQRSLPQIENDRRCCASSGEIPHRSMFISACLATDRLVQERQRRSQSPREGLPSIPRPSDTPASLRAPVEVWPGLVPQFRRTCASSLIGTRLSEVRRCRQRLFRTGYSSVVVLSDGTVREWGATYGELTPRRPPAAFDRSHAVTSTSSRSRRPVVS